MLEALIASIAKKMCDTASVTKVYFDQVTEVFVTPSLYFPPSEQTAAGDTLTTFKYDNVLYVKVFEQNTKTAMALAEKITHSISLERNLIAILNKDGSDTGKKLRLKDLSYKKTEVGVAQIYIRFESVYAFTSQTQPKVAKIVWQMGLK